MAVMKKPAIPKRPNLWLTVWFNNYDQGWESSPCLWSSIETCYEVFEDIKRGYTFNFGPPVWFHIFIPGESTDMTTPIHVPVIEATQSVRHCAEIPKRPEMWFAIRYDFSESPEDFPWYGVGPFKTKQEAVEEIEGYERDAIDLYYIAHVPGED